MTATLGTSRDAQIIEEYEGESRQKFILHYSFPPFSVGEVKFLRGPSRREIGHGVLARRALTPLLPHEEDFPYTVRVVSDILESNGSSSMASVCGGSLALFDAGVPMLAPVAGVAMGLIKSDDSFAVLSDIAGQEDHYGDMDFKVAGTRDGVTALQMDIKIAGVTQEIMQVALEQAREGRFHILDIMDTAIGTPRADISEFAPRLHTILVPKDKIRDIIGPGGKTIRSITEETGCEIEIDNDGKVTIASPDGVAAKRAREIIERLTETPEVGKVYEGIVRRVEAYGAFVEILPGSDGLVHISELAPYRVRDVTDIVQEGDSLKVKVINIDEQGKVRLSRKAVIMEAPDYNPEDYAGKDYDGPPPSRGRGDAQKQGSPQRRSRRTKWRRRTRRRPSITKPALGAIPVQVPILIVDDESAVRELVRSQIQGLGFHCSTAGSGEEALRLSRQPPPPSLVLTDVRMPGIGGEELLHELKTLDGKYSSGHDLGIPGSRYGPTVLARRGL